MQLLRRPISTFDGIPDRFYVISMEFLSLSSRRSSARNVPAAKSAEKQMFSQAVLFRVRTYPVCNSVSTLEIGAVQLRPVTEIAPKSPFLR